MPYLGTVELKASDIRRIDITSSTSATHTLTWTAPNEQSLIVTINGVKQQNNYTVSGTTLTLDSALSASDLLEVIGINDIGTTITPAQGSVDTDQMANDAITSAKIADGAIVDADINASAAIDATKIADGTVTSTEFQYINSLSSNAQTQITSVTTTANAALPKAGGTMTGETIFADQLASRPQMKDYAETVNAIGSITAGTNANIEDGNVQSVTMTANTFNFGFTNALASHSNSLTLIITNGGLATVTWLSGAHDGGGNAVQWAGGTAPTLTSSGTDILTFTTFNGGTNWYGFSAGIAMAAP